MTVRFASFNVENLFARPKALNQETWVEGEPILKAYAEFNRLIELAVYSSADKAQMIQLLIKLEVYTSKNGVVHRNNTRDPRWAWLRANRGDFDVDSPTNGIRIVANGRGDWIGWLELAIEPVEELAVRMTARVIADLKADVLAVVEAEDRPALKRFNEELLANQYRHIMLIDGNDTRGIDVGIMTTDKVDIAGMFSNVDLPDPGAAGESLFSRDCAEYRCRVPSGAEVLLLVNHFKSQSGGGDAKRSRQAQGVRAIVEARLVAGEQHIVVLGDLNEGPDALGQAPPNLGPLFDATGPLVDAYSLQGFDTGKRPGSFQNCSIRNRFDYILLSKPLAQKLKGGGIERHGLWGTPTNVKKPMNWDIYPEITRAAEAASDHGAVFVDLDI